jgi:hypothetical protein
MSFIFTFYMKSTLNILSQNKINEWGNSFSRTNFGKNIWTNFGRGGETNLGGKSPQGQVLVQEVPNNYQGVRGAWPISTSNLGPIGPKPDPVDPAKVISVFDEKIINKGWMNFGSAHRVRFWSQRSDMKIKESEGPGLQPPLIWAT